MPDESTLSILIFLPSILRHCLPVMTRFAQRLPVPFIPKQHRISSMGFYMINNCRLDVFPFLHASHAQGMHLEEPFPGFLPRGSVSSLGSAGTIRSVFYLMLLAVGSPVGNQGRTTWMLTRCIWSSWHSILLFWQQKRPGSTWLQDLSSSCQFIL